MAYFVDGLRSRIVLALGLTPLMLGSQFGCAVRSLDGPDDIGDDSADDEGADGENSSDPTATGGGSNSGTGSPTSTTSGPPMQTCWPSESYYDWEIWLPAAPDGQCTCDEECQSVALDQWNEANCCDSCWYMVGQVLCSEPWTDAQCHYTLSMVEEGCGEGRPLFVDASLRIASPCTRDDWTEAGMTPSVEHLEAEHRQALAKRWTDTALAEHASVASFARFVLDLSALGAPPQLLVDATAAMHDEIRHAQIAFGLASAYAGQPVGPGPIPMHGVTAGADAEAIVRAAVREGCIAETLAAAEAELAARRATDPVVRAALTSIADDEARHAVLAWRFVDWAVQRDGSLARAVREELAAAASLADAQEHAQVDALPADLGSAHGVLPSAIRHQLRARCFTDTVRPCAAAMLHGSERGGSTSPVA